MRRKKYKRCKLPYGAIQLCSELLKNSAQAQPWLLNEAQSWLLNEDLLLTKVQKSLSTNYLKNYQLLYKGHARHEINIGKLFTRWRFSIKTQSPFWVTDWKKLRDFGLTPTDVCTLYSILLRDKTLAVNVAFQKSTSDLESVKLIVLHTSCLEQINEWQVGKPSYKKNGKKTDNVYPSSLIWA